MLQCENELEYLHLWRDKCVSCEHFPKALVYFFLEVPLGIHWNIDNTEGVPRTLPENFGIFLLGSSSRHLLDNFSQWLIHNFNRGYFSPSARAQWPKTHLVLDKISGLFTFFVCLKILHYSIFLLNISNLVSSIFIVRLNYWKGCIERFIVGYLFVCYQLLVFKFLIISFFEIEMIGRDAFDVLVIGRCTHQTWYCRNSNRICSCQSILSLDPKTSDDEKGSDPEHMKGNRNYEID